MPIQIFNSLTNKKEEFKPIEPGKVRMYVCGVTVYDRSHIGHARGAFVFDVVRNYLKHRGYKVTYIRNITDVDDKIIEKARELVAAGESESIIKAVEEISQKYTKSYYDDMQSLGIGRADIEPKATEHINEMIEIIKGLVEKGFAYEADGDVYFDVSKYADYGKLSNQSIDDLQSGVRKEVDEKKRNPLDFALWKKSKEDEPAWPSPFSKGRPGWHIECSAMSQKYLKATFDIHGGGRDLIFPHHENEIAQSECFSGRPFANYWMHNGLLTIEGQKMAKSVGNIVFISDFLKRYQPDVLKIFFLTSHYSSPVDYSDAKMQEAKKSLEKFSILFSKIQEQENEHGSVRASSSKAERPDETSILLDYIEKVENLRADFLKAMDDDFNTPQALSAMFELTTLANKLLADSQVIGGSKLGVLKSIKYTLIEYGRILGLFRGGQEEKKDKKMHILDKVINVLISLRQEARQKKDFELSDAIRDKLEEAGVVLEDSAEKTTWRLKE